MDRIEKVILRNLIYNEEYLRKVLPFVEPDYFNDRNERVVFEHITKYAAEYNSLITKEVLQIEIEDRRDITQDEVKNIYGTIDELEDIECDFEWLSDTTEKWCRDRAIYLALMESIKIADGQDDKKNRDAIPTILSDALSVSFNRNVGHDLSLIHI